VIDPEVLAAVLGGQSVSLGLDRLSSREREVLSGLAEGRSNDEIADALALTEPDVERHVASILEKLGLPPRGDERRRTLVMRLLAHS
jgi:DNA-binding NarL/FixJ family response regulator